MFKRCRMHESLLLISANPYHYGALMLTINLSLYILLREEKNIKFELIDKAFLADYSNNLENTARS